MLRRLLAMACVLGGLGIDTPARAASTSSPTALREVVIEINRLRRHYLLLAPSDLDQSTPAPLVLMLHGFGGTAAAAALHYGWCELAAKEKFIAAFPEATRFDMTRAPALGSNSPMWNDGSGRGFAGWKKVDDVDYLRRVIDDVSKQCKIDPDRIYCTGFSNGASMTWRAGVELSDKLAAIAPVSGHLWLADPKPANKIPALFLFGDSDPFNPVNGGPASSPYGGTETKPPLQKSIDAWMKVLGVDATSHTIRDDGDVHALRYGEENSRTELDVYTISHLGHEWPGHGRVLPKAMTGETSNAIDATAVIWEFFKNHPKK